MNLPESWFSADYTEARARFRAAAEQAGAALSVHRNPNARQPDGNDLTTDVARLGPAPGEAATVLIASSGTHGVEGFCGSGCQVGMLETGSIDLLPKGCALVLVHAINPYGFAWLRRVTEDNIDLNRNNLDHSAGHPANPKYAEVHDWLTPRDWHGPGREEADAAIAAYIAERGLFAFQEAVSGGQYDYPDGLFFGGRRSPGRRRPGGRSSKPTAAAPNGSPIWIFTPASATMAPARSSASKAPTGPAPSGRPCGMATT